jgi:hypothetical protein
MDTRHLGRLGVGDCFGILRGHLSVVFGVNTNKTLI